MKASYEPTILDEVIGDVRFKTPETYYLLLGHMFKWFYQNNRAMKECIIYELVYLEEILDDKW